jgi:hypothetical protein
MVAWRGCRSRHRMRPPGSSNREGVQQRTERGLWWVEAGAGLRGGQWRGSEKWAREWAWELAVGERFRKVKVTKCGPAGYHSSNSRVPGVSGSVGLAGAASHAMPSRTAQPVRDFAISSCGEHASTRRMLGSRALKPSVRHVFLRMNSNT